MSLFDSIEVIVDQRNELVHSGKLNVSLVDARINKCLSYFEVAVDRFYEHIAQIYGFSPSHDY